MAPSKSTRILILLGIDTVFFLIELIAGYAVHSLALVADSFHMLNDVLSLCVGFWAVKVANQKTSSKMYTYGVSTYHYLFCPTSQLTLFAVATRRDSRCLDQRCIPCRPLCLDLP